jgi:hypothetical protein
MILSAKENSSYEESNLSDILTENDFTAGIHVMAFSFEKYLSRH